MGGYVGHVGPLSEEEIPPPLTPHNTHPTLTHLHLHPFMPHAPRTHTLISSPHIHPHPPTQGWITEQAYRAQAQGPMSSGAPKPEPLREVAVMYLLFVVEKGVFYSFANGFNSVYLCCVRKS